MADGTNLAGKHATFANSRAAGNAALGDHDHVLTELDVVRDLDQIIDLAAFAD